MPPRASAPAAPVATPPSGLHCDNCLRDLQTVRAYIICAAAECQDLISCPDCFVTGANVEYPHRQDHPYRVIDRYVPSPITAQWSGDDELRFLHALATHGPHHWTEVASIVGKTARQCEKHYQRLLSPASTSSSESDSGNETGSESDVTVPDPGNETPLTGYMPKRGDMEVEYDDQAENLIADLVINDSDTLEEKKLKMRLLEIYDARLKRRDQMKAAVIARNLVNPSSLRIRDRRATRDEKELVARLQIFARLLPKEKYDELHAAIMKEYRTTRDLHRMVQARNIGMKRRAELELYENVRRERISHITAMQDSVDDDLPLVSPLKEQRTKRRRVTINQPPSTIFSNNSQYVTASVTPPVTPLLSPSASANAAPSTASVIPTTHNSSIAQLNSNVSMDRRNSAGTQRPIEATLRIRREREMANTSNSLLSATMGMDSAQVNMHPSNSEKADNPTTAPLSGLLDTRITSPTMKDVGIVDHGDIEKENIRANVRTTPANLEHIPLHRKDIVTRAVNATNLGSGKAHVNAEKAALNIVDAAMNSRRTRNKKRLARSHYPQLDAMPIKGLPDAWKLNVAERKACAILNMMPSDFLARRDAMLYTAAKQIRAQCTGRAPAPGILTLRSEFRNNSLAVKHVNLKADEPRLSQQPQRAQGVGRERATRQPVGQPPQDEQPSYTEELRHVDMRELEGHISKLRAGSGCSEDHAQLPKLPLSENSVIPAHLLMPPIWKKIPWEPSPWASASTRQAPVTLPYNVGVSHGVGNENSESTPSLSQPVMYSANRDVSTMTESNDIDDTALEYIPISDFEKGMKADQQDSTTPDIGTLNNPTEAVKPLCEQGPKVLHLSAIMDKVQTAPAPRDSRSKTAVQSVNEPALMQNIGPLLEAGIEKMDNGGMDNRNRSQRPEAGVQYLASDVTNIVDDDARIGAKLAVPLLIQSSSRALMMGRGEVENQHSLRSAFLPALHVRTHSSGSLVDKEILTPVVTPVLRENSDNNGRAESSPDRGNQLMVEVEITPLGSSLHNTDAIGHQLREALHNVNKETGSSGVDVNPSSPTSNNTSNRAPEGGVAVSGPPARAESLFGKNRLFDSSVEKTAEEATKHGEGVSQYQNNGREIVVFSTMRARRQIPSLGIAPEPIMREVTEIKHGITVAPLITGEDRTLTEQVTAITKSAVHAKTVHVEEPEPSVIEVKARIGSGKMPANTTVEDSTPLKAPSSRRSRRKSTLVEPPVVVEEERPAKRRRRSKRIESEDEEDADALEIINTIVPIKKKAVGFILLPGDGGNDGKAEYAVSAVKNEDDGDDAMLVLNPAQESDIKAPQNRPSGRRASLRKVDQRKKVGEVSKSKSTMMMKRAPRSSVDPVILPHRGLAGTYASSEPIFVNLRIKPPVDYRGGLRYIRGRERCAATNPTRGGPVKTRSSLRLSKRLNGDDDRHDTTEASSVINMQPRPEVESHEEEEVLAEGKSMDIYIEKPYSTTPYPGNLATRFIASAHQPRGMAIDSNGMSRQPLPTLLFSPTPNSLVSRKRSAINDVVVDGERKADDRNGILLPENRRSVEAPDYEHPGAYGQRSSSNAAQGDDSRCVLEHPSTAASSLIEAIKIPVMQEDVEKSAFAVARPVHGWTAIDQTAASSSSQLNPAPDEARLSATGLPSVTLEQPVAVKVAPSIFQSVSQKEPPATPNTPAKITFPSIPSKLRAAMNLEFCSLGGTNLMGKPSGIEQNGPVQGRTEQEQTELRLQSPFQRLTPTPTTVMATLNQNLEHSTQGQLMSSAQQALLVTEPSRHAVQDTADAPLMEQEATRPNEIESVVAAVAQTAPVEPNPDFGALTLPSERALAIDPIPMEVQPVNGNHLEILSGVKVGVGNELEINTVQHTESVNVIEPTGNENQPEQLDSIVILNEGRNEQAPAKSKMIVGPVPVFIDADAAKFVVENSSRDSPSPRKSYLSNAQVHLLQPRSNPGSVKSGSPRKCQPTKPRSPKKYSSVEATSPKGFEGVETLVIAPIVEEDEHIFEGGKQESQGGDVAIDVDNVDTVPFRTFHRGNELLLTRRRSKRIHQRKQAEVFDEVEQADDVSQPQSGSSRSSPSRAPRVRRRSNSNSPRTDSPHSPLAKTTIKSGGKRTSTRAKGGARRTNKNNRKQQRGINHDDVTMVGNQEPVQVEEGDDEIELEPIVHVQGLPGSNSSRNVLEEGDADELHIPPGPRYQSNPGYHPRRYPATEVRRHHHHHHHRSHQSLSPPRSPPTARGSLSNSLVEDFDGNANCPGAQQRSASPRSAASQPRRSSRRAAIGGSTKNMPPRTRGSRTANTLVEEHYRLRSKGY